MIHQTELRIFDNRKESLLQKGINNLIVGNIKNLIIEEDVIMLERLKAQREVYVSALEALKQTDLEAVKQERFELVKEQIAHDVQAEHDAKIDEAELKISHYDFVIADEEAKAAAENENVEDNENMEG